ncbi:hypothetical protein O0L34_g12097 [Tuta absoluta]|nr:hypothetical protein O0L34_g12097 [Tuta absoluta]
MSHQKCPIKNVPFPKMPLFPKRAVVSGTVVWTCDGSVATAASSLKRKPEDRADVKEETVEEDGLYYGELDAANMEYNDVSHYRLSRGGLHRHPRTHPATHYNTPRDKQMSHSLNVTFLKCPIINVTLLKCPIINDTFLKCHYP